MDPNPYASPVAPLTDEIRARSVLLLAFVLCLFLLFAIISHIWGGAIIFAPMDYGTFTKLLLSDSAIVSILGIANFTKLARECGKPAKLMYLARSICIAHLIVTGTMLPMLLCLQWYIGFTYILPTILGFACVEVLLLHLSLRRFEYDSRLANLTLCALLIVDVGIGVVANAFQKPYIEYGTVTELFWALGLEFGQLVICVLLTLRVLAIHRTWRSEAQPQGRNDHEDA